MKKLLLIFTVASMLCSNAALAQKVDAEGISSKLEKSDADVANAKKSAKANTWLSRGDIYFGSISEPTKALYTDMPVEMLLMTCGKTAAKEQEVAGKKYMVYSYPYVDVYTQNNMVFAWKVKKEVREGALEVALEAYAKALELDSAIAEKAKASMTLVFNYYKALGDSAIKLNDLPVGAEAFKTAAEVQAHPAYNDVDPTMLFYSGYMYTMDGEKNPASFAKGEEMLQKALDAGMCEMEDANEELDDKSRGSAYYYAYYSAYSQREGNPEKLQVAKKYLQEGITRYPLNEKIFEGLLQLYTAEKGMGDPSELLPNIEAAIAKDAKNMNAWFSRGRIYFAMKDYDECIASFQKVVELQPDGFDGNYYLALFYMLKADSMLDDIKGVTYTDQSKFDADVAKMNAVYLQSIPYFEKAYEARPTDKSTVNYLKQLCFRLRDEAGIMDKYTKYNEIFKTM